VTQEELTVYLHEVDTIYPQSYNSIAIVQWFKRKPAKHGTWKINCFNLSWTEVVVPLMAVIRTQCCMSFVPRLSCLPVGQNEPVLRSLFCQPTAWYLLQDAFAFPTGLV